MTDYITEDELTEAINILKYFAKDHLNGARSSFNHVPDLDDKVMLAVKYIDKAMADDDLVMVYYP